MTKPLETIITIMLLIIFVSMMALLVYNHEPRPSSNEFCVKNGYAYSVLDNRDGGVCMLPSQNRINLPNNQYYGWDGTKWRFIGK